MHAQLDFVRNPCEVLLGLRQLRFALAEDRSLPATFEQVNTCANTDRAEAVGKER
jgi:hypothetical protein